MPKGTTYKHLDWPRHKPRTQEEDRRRASFHSNNGLVGMDTALRRLNDQIMVLDRKYITPYVLTTGGLGRNNRPLTHVKDPGAAVYFEMFGAEIVLACDKWDRAPDNIVAIAKHIESLRGQERWGVATTKEAFAGHMALPAPMTGSEPWFSVLNFKDPDIVTEADIKARYRSMAKQHHPDTGDGNNDRMTMLTQAKEEGLADVARR